MAEIQERLERALSDRYRVERELGHGGMAIVYLATDLKHARRVAIKVLRPALAYALGPERFLREIAIAAQLAHPNILPLHDSGEADGLLYYVMPYVEGESLRDRLNRERRLPAAEAVRIATEVADALAHAHDQGLIHRDIKPENILLQAGHALVSDFGIARAISAAGTDRLTETGLAVGTPAYMSPEQALGQTSLDGRSDVYSLGCLLFEMLASAPPFQGQTPQAVIAGHATVPVPRLRALGVSAPGSVQAALDVAMAKDPGERFASPRDFAAALAGAPVPSPGRTRRIAAAIFALVILAGLGWWGTRFIGTGGAPAIASLAVLPLENLSRDTAQDYLVAGIHEALIDELARVSALRVISRTSTLGYRGTSKPVPEIARELGVDGVVEGSVLRSGDSVSIQVHLVQARPEERQLWAQRYDRDLRHVLALYRDVSLAVARQVQSTLSPAAGARLGPAEAVDPEVYEAFLKGKFHWYYATPGDLDAAFEYFTRALGKDPAYPLAHAGISAVWISRQQMGYVPPGEAAPRAEAAALRALALDSMLAWGHHDLAMIRIQSKWDWPAAETAFVRTIALNPHFADAHAFYSHLLNIEARPAEAREQMNQALALDPLNPMFLALDAVDLLYERRWDDAIAQSRKALAIAAANPVALNALWLALEEQRRYPEAADAAARYLAAGAQPEAAAAVTRGFAEGGYREAMRRGAAALATRSRSAYVSAGDVATLSTSAGETAQALEWLEKGYETRDPNMPYIGWPNFARLRNDPRFQALLRRMRLPA
jgi:eukaryotic-like serine/threonine-protein kinase